MIMMKIMIIMIMITMKMMAMEKRRLISIDKTGAARLSINLPPRLLSHSIFSRS